MVVVPSPLVRRPPPRLHLWLLVARPALHPRPPYSCSLLRSWGCFSFSIPSFTLRPTLRPIFLVLPRVPARPHRLPRSLRVIVISFASSAPRGSRSSSLLIVVRVASPSSSFSLVPCIMVLADSFPPAFLPPVCRLPVV